MVIGGSADAAAVAGAVVAAVVAAVVSGGAAVLVALLVEYTGVDVGSHAARPRRRSENVDRLDLMVVVPLTAGEWIRSVAPRPPGK
jgi:hypothetical protein